jgi:hypothetical protein
MLIYFGGRLVLNQVLPIADLVAFFLYLEMLYQPVRALSTAWESVQQALAGAERVAELLDEPDVMVERPDALALPGPGPGRHLPSATCGFAYAAGDTVLEQINLDDRPRAWSWPWWGPPGWARRRWPAGPALLRRLRGVDHPGRARPSRPDAQEPAAADQHRAPGRVPLSRHGAGEHPLWPPDATEQR